MTMPKSIPPGEEPMSISSVGKSPNDVAWEFHTRVHQLKQELQKTALHLKEPKGQALLETAAEVLDGLESAFDHYARKAERTWKD